MHTDGWPILVDDMNPWESHGTSPFAAVCRYMRSVGSFYRGLGRHGHERRAAIAEHRCPITMPVPSSS